MEILAGYVGKGHIYWLVSEAQHLSASKLVQYIKGNISRKLQMEYKEWNKEFRSRHLWARGYLEATSGNVTDEIMQESIRKSDNLEAGQL